MPGSADLCFLTDENVEKVLEVFQDARVEVWILHIFFPYGADIDWRSLQVLEGAKVVERTGAVGKIRSVYVRDPDGNLIEWVFLPFLLESYLANLVCRLSNYVWCTNLGIVTDIFVPFWSYTFICPSYEQNRTNSGYNNHEQPQEYHR